MAAKLSKAGKITLRIYVLVLVVIPYHVTACASAVYYVVILIILFLIILGSDFRGNTARSDMKRELDSYGGVKSCKVAANDVDVSKQA